MQKLIIILAGYEKDINHLMSVNPGLTSRFPEVVDFRTLSPSECIGLMRHYFQGQKAILEKKNPNISLDLSCLQTPVKVFEQAMLQLFSSLSCQEGWASARDVLTMAKKIFSKTIKSIGDIKKEARHTHALSQQLVQDELETLLRERSTRAVSAQKLPPSSSQPPTAQLPNMLPNRPNPSGSISAAKEMKPPAPPPECSEVVQVVQPDNSDDEFPRPPAQMKAKRDAGVSDEVWEQLQKDKEAAAKREDEYRALKKQKDEATGEARRKILERLLEEEQRRRQEALEKERLAKRGLCPMGFEWIKQEGGYRCAGGSHFVGDQ
jgi:hypothetical protein